MSVTGRWDGPAKLSGPLLDLLLVRRLRRNLRIARGERRLSRLDFTELPRLVSPPSFTQVTKL